MTHTSHSTFSLFGRQHFFSTYNLHLTETLKGLTYRFKQCEPILNVLQFTFWY